MALSPTDVFFPIRALTKAISNLDRRLRKLEHREMPASGTTPPIPPDPGTDPVTPGLGSGWLGAPPYQSVSYWRDGSNIVHLRGTATASGMTFPSTMFTLATDMRPPAQLSYGVPTYAVVDVMPTGEVVVRTAQNYVSLDGISFRRA